MLLRGVTINDGRDGRPDFSSAWVGVNSNIGALVAIMVARKGDMCPKSDTQLV
jgi:hypothetical protein